MSELQDELKQKEKLIEDFKRDVARLEKSLLNTDKKLKQQKKENEATKKRYNENRKSMQELLKKTDYNYEDLFSKYENLKNLLNDIEQKELQK